MIVSFERLRGFCEIKIKMIPKQIESCLKAGETHAAEFHKGRLDELQSAWNYIQEICYEEEN